MGKQGLTIIYTGNGKGKTTASLGQAIRAVGQDFRVCVIQFIKGKWKTGESNVFSKLGDLAEFHVMGSGFTWQSDKDEILQAAQEGWNLAKEKISSGNYDMVVLDELTYLIKYQLIEESEIIRIIEQKPENLHLVISGRDASTAIIDAADLVTEMKEVKHPYASGIKAQKGIEY